MSLAASVRAAVESRAFAFGTSRAQVAAAASEIARLGGGAVLGIVFFGSRRSGAARSDSFSAHDFFVVVRAYLPFYKALHARGAIHRGPTLMAWVSRILPPSQISLRLEGEGGQPFHAKCSVIDLQRFERETSPRRRDHFCIGRLFQPSDVVYAADPAVDGALVDALARAHVETYRWVRPWLEAPFEAEGYCLTLLRVSLSQEIRPEPEGRAQALFAAQREELLPVYDLLLTELAAEGELVTRPGGFALARPVGLGERLRLRVYFARSLVRATVRWLKHVVTFEGWLDYIVRKVRRHAGTDIELSPRERRLPLLFLWPRLFRYFRHKNR
jgi:hypothetical protein